MPTKGAKEMTPKPQDKRRDNIIVFDTLHDMRMSKRLEEKASASMLQIVLEKIEMLRMREVLNPFRNSARMFIDAEELKAMLQPFSQNVDENHQPQNHISSDSNRKVGMAEAPLLDTKPNAQSEQEISDTDMVTSKSGTLKSLPKDSPASVGRKGCGKEDYPAGDEMIKCGERGYLCPSCKEQKK